MPPRAGLSKAETQIARIVWSLGEATVRQVLEALPAARELDYKTVQTYLRRLEAKGYLRARRAGKSIRYRPRIAPARVIRDTVRDFVNRLFDGDPLPLVQQLIRDGDLGEADIEKLRAMIDQWEKQNHEPHHP